MSELVTPRNPSGECTWALTLRFDVASPGLSSPAFSPTRGSLLVGAGATGLGAGRDAAGAGALGAAAGAGLGACEVWVALLQAPSATSPNVNHFIADLILTSVKCTSLQAGLFPLLQTRKGTGRFHRRFRPDTSPPSPPREAERGTDVFLGRGGPEQYHGVPRVSGP